MIILSLTVYCQDTIYVDYLNRQYNSVPPQFIAYDTITVKDDSAIINQLLIGPTSNYDDTLDNTYNSYYVEYTVEELQGGTSGFFQIDTNSTQLSFTTLSSVTGKFITDSLKLDSASDLSFSLSASAANTTLKVLGEIYHTTTTIHVRHNLPAITTVYYDRKNDSVVSKSFASQFTPIEVKNDTTYWFDTSMVNVWNSNPTFTVNVPTTYHKYHLQYKLTHKAGGYGWNVDTNNTYVVGNSNAHPTKFYHLSGNTPLLDSMLISDSSSIDFELSNGSNGGRYQVDCRVFHTVDTVFINSLSTDIKEITPKSSIKAYPNPTRDFINIVGWNSKEFVMFDIKGRVLKRGIVNNRIDLKELSKGIYFVNIENTVLKVLRE